MNKGFTLLEVLIALAIFPLFVFGVYGLLNQCIFTQGYAEKRLELILSSTIPVFTHIDHIPEATGVWVDMETDCGIDAYFASREPVGIYDITKLKWKFKKDNIVVEYEFYTR